jgi:hypothetical protein
MVVLRRSLKVRVVLCRAHGPSLARSFLGRTLVQGWWGIISFFSNFFAVGSDVLALIRASQLAAPGSIPSPGLPPLPGTFEWLSGPIAGSETSQGQCQLALDYDSIYVLAHHSASDVVISRTEVRAVRYQESQRRNWATLLIDTASVQFTFDALSSDLRPLYNTLRPW